MNLSLIFVGKRFVFPTVPPNDFWDPFWSRLLG